LTINFLRPFVNYLIGIYRLAEHPTIDKFVPMCGMNFTFNDKIYINTTILSPCKAGCTGVQKGNNSMDRNYEGIF